MVLSVSTLGDMQENSDRTAIIAAAKELFYARGYAGVGMDDIRDAAGISLRRLYREFPSKESVVLGVLGELHEDWEAGVQAAVAAENDPTDRVLAIYDYLADWFATDDFRGCGFINAFAELGANSAAVAEIARTHKASFQRYVGELVSDAGGTPRLASQLAILAEGAQTTAAIAGTVDAAADARDAALTLIGAGTVDR